MPYTPGGVHGNPSSATPRIYWNFANTQTGTKDTTYASGPSFAMHTAYGLSGTVDRKLSDELSFKSIAGWRQVNWRVGVDLDCTPESIQEVTDHQFQRQVSQEFQLNGRAMDNRLMYTTGLYYFQVSGFVHDYVPFGGTLGITKDSKLLKRPAVSKVNAAIHYLSASDKYEVTLGGTHITDERYIVVGSTNVAGGEVVGTCSRPREWYLSLSAKL